MRSLHPRGPQLVATLVACGLLVACGVFKRDPHTLPSRPAGEALFRDLERLVTLSETEGWGIDRHEIRSLLPAALESLCRSAPEHRERLGKWLDARVFALGGDPAKVYEARGSDLDRISELLTVHRIRLLFVAANESAAEDCPFYLQGKSNFAGRQILDDRFLLSVGGGGKGIVVRQGGNTDLHFGGAGRLLFGRAFGPHATFLVGAEAGGSAAFPKQEDGERGNLRIAVDLAIPLVYRHRLVNSYWELEAGYLGHFVEGDDTRNDGFRVGLSVGGNTSRRRWLFPGAAFGIAYERVWDSAEFLREPPITFVKVGFRVALDIAL